MKFHAKMWNFQEIDASLQQEKMTDFNCCGIFKEYIKQNIIMAALRKANFHLAGICR